MRITFKVRYHTEFGQSLWLCGNHPLLGNDRAETALPLSYLNSEFWSVDLEFPPDTFAAGNVVYRYVLRQHNGDLVEDWGNDRVLKGDRGAEILIIDSWNDPGAPGNVFYTEPFQQVLLKSKPSGPQSPSPAKITHQFKVKAPLLAPTETLCLLGNTPALGQWSTQAPLVLSRAAGEPFFSLDMDLGREPWPVFYKYGVFDSAKNAFVRYEDGPNRMVTDPAAENRLVIVNDGFANAPAVAWRGAGVAIPVFSLRTEKSFGIGEFTDLNSLVDWCARTGIKLIQILPVNDTTATHSWRDSYPYSGISAFALHPLYVNLSRIASAENQALVAELEGERLRLNALDSVDYESVLKAKFGLLQRLFHAQGKKTLKSAEYRRFFERNKNWLVPYAVFCQLRDQFGTADFTKWPSHRRYDRAEAAALRAPGSAAAHTIDFYCFIQFHLHLQLEQAAAYAHAHGVILKGDIPIGVYRHGVDAWQEPEQYRMEMQAGAPPDPFSDKGQNWSFPTYDWPRMKATGFAWWKQRFEQMGRYFDAFRIDHALGFFRIWSIPMHAVEGILGYFVPALPVHVNEFSARGIPFDHDRFVKPFINDTVLQETFGPRQQEVRDTFLISTGPGRYTFKPEFSTQRQVQAYFTQQDQAAGDTEVLKLGLFDLLSNVILLEPPDGLGQQYHFRFGIETTSSFRAVDLQTQARLKELYVDYFFRRQEEFWRKEGLQKLPALKRATNMLVCGEDLGMVPTCVPEVMKQLGLLSLEVQRMPKRLNQQFSRPKEAPYLSVVTPSTHDMSTIRGWWEEDRNVTQLFFNQELGEPGVAPMKCDPWINKAIVSQHLASPAMWSIFQLQDLLGMDAGLRRSDPGQERINVPANPSHYWQYRMHLTIEQLLAAEPFNQQLRQMLADHAR